MRTITIEIPEPGDEFRWVDVVLSDGRRCQGLGWDEMLRQVVALTHPGLADSWEKHSYPMATPEQWALREQQRAERFDARRAVAAIAQADATDALRQWAAAERNDDPQEMANARAERDRLIAKPQGTT